MIVFALFAIVLTLVALSFLLPTLLRDERDSSNLLRNDINLAVMRDQIVELDRDLAFGTIAADQFAAARSDLEQRLIQEQQPEAPATQSRGSRRLTLAIGLAVPVLAAGMYLLMGNGAALDPAQAVANDQPHEVSEQQIMQMVNTLAEKLKTQPNNVEGWNMLARSYNALGRYQDAAAAYAHLVGIEPKNADYLVSYADTLAVTLNKNLQGEPDKLIRRALLLDPQNVRGLSLAGSAAFDRHDYADAIAYWKEVLNLVQPDTDMARDTLSSIGEAQSLIAGTAQSATSPATTVASLPANISGSVDLTPGFKASASPTDTVFIFARAEQGPAYPLAAMRSQVKDLPLHFMLDDSMSVMPNVHLSGHARVLVGARISKSGNAAPQSGDLESTLQSVALGADQVTVSINTLHH